MLGSASLRQTVPSLRATCPRLKLVIPKATGSSVLDRPPVDIVVPPPNYDFVPSHDHDKGFQDYVSAAGRMEEMERLAAELLKNLNELNVASDAFDSTPTPDFHELQHQEARRAKRAAAREARKTQTAATQATAPTRSEPRPASSPQLKGTTAVTQKPVPVSQQTTSIQHSSTAAASPSSSSPSPANAPTVASMTAALSVRTPATRTALGPSLVPRATLGSGPSLAAGPSLSAVQKSRPQGLQTEPSAWAREANARRARSSSTRKASAASSLQEAGRVRSKVQAGGGASDGTSLFMKRSAGHDLLNGVSEKDLANIVKDALFIEKVKADLKGVLNREPSMAEWAKALSMEPSAFIIRVNAGQHAKSVMLQANYRLVIAICKKYQNRGMALQDLITEGIKGLLTGVEKFDADKGFRFSTYAHWWIRQAVTRALSAQSRDVRLPAHIAELLNRIKYTRAQLVEEYSREPSMEELAAAVQLTPKRVSEIMAMAYQSGSLDSVVGDDESGGTMKDQLEDERSTPDQNLEDLMFGKEMDNILVDLTEREAGVIRMRFGLAGEHVATLEEIGARFSLTRERIRQIEAKAIRKLKSKHTLFSGILQEYAMAEAEADIVARTSNGTNKSKM